MERRTLGRTGPTTSAVGLGCMAMSGSYGLADKGASIRTIHAALEAGVRLLDTGDFYGMGDNELLIGEALAGGEPDAHAHDARLGERGVEHPVLTELGLQAVGRAEDTAVAADVLTEHDDILVAGEGDAHRILDRLDDVGFHSLPTSPISPPTETGNLEPSGVIWRMKWVKRAVILPFSRC